jgi:DNA mismatch repair protein MutS2
MQSVDDRTLIDLEFPVIRERLLHFSIGQSAKDRITQLAPKSHFPSIEKELNRLNELVSIRRNGEIFPALDFEELLAEIRLLPIKNAVLQLEGYLKICRASELVNAILTFFDKKSHRFPLLSELLTEAYFETGIIDAVNKVFDRKGAIRDDASKKLLEIRQRIKTLKNQINRNFDKELRRLSKENLLGETREAFLHERRVLTVLSTHKRKISGMVLGSSKTGSLTFIEPQVNILLNNELELELDDERKEIYRILQQLTSDISNYLPLIKTYQKILTEFDFINAKSRLALEMNAVLPGISKKTKIELIDAYHPILWKANKEIGKPTFPQHITMDASSRMLVISGPNAGGKSITLKTIGLLQIMLQSGLLVPLNENSVMCFFQDIHSDIGDNQSIENELSTYSYRLKRMKFFLEIANKRSLLLLDEFGTGSDPELGGALAEVFFEELYKKRCYSVITTHYSNIKIKAAELPNAVNGCMLFNSETLEPLYKLSIGQPGSSFTFEVAQINGIQMEIIDAAKSKLDSKKLRIDQLLSDLQKEKNHFENLNKAHREAQDWAEAKYQEYLERKNKLDDKLKQVSDAIDRDGKFVSLGKRMAGYIDKYQTHNRKKANNEALFEEIRKYLAIEKSKIIVKEKAAVLKEKANLPAKKTNKKKIDTEKETYKQHLIKVGASVKLIATRQMGTVESIENNQVTVLFGFLRMKVEREKLMWLEDQKK